MVAHLARLARLELSPQELERCGRDLRKILAAFASLSGDAPVNRAQGAPNGTPDAEGTLSARTRPDVVSNTLEKGVFLDQAPDTDGTYVRVPSILGGGS